MIEIFAEYGVIGVMVMLFAGQMMFLQKTLMGKLLEIEEITVKLIDKHNKSDSDTFRKLDSVTEAADRRYEKLVGEINSATDSLNYVMGKLNNK